MTAAEILLESGCCSLPIDINRIAQAHGIKIISFSKCTELYDMDIGDIYRNISHMGFSFLDEQHYICAINEKACGKQRRRWTTAHELAHVFLGHIDGAAAPMPAEYEKAADRFTAELLAPLCVLHFCSVASAEEIAMLTGLSAQAAQIRWRELCTLRRRHSEQMRLAARHGSDLHSARDLLPDRHSEQLLMQFLPFIAEYITRKQERQA